MFQKFNLSRHTRKNLDVLVESRLAAAGPPLLINTINPHSFVLSQSDERFRDALIKTDVLLVDGIGVVFAEFFLNGRFLKRYTGPEFFVNTLNMLGSSSNRVNIGIIGPNDDLISRATQKIEQSHKNIKVNFGYAPPYLEHFDSASVADICCRLQNFQLDVLWVCLGAPKQEKLILDISSIGNAKILSGVGAALSFYTGDVRRAPKLLRLLGLEWLHRSILAPRRLGRRNLSSNPKFVFELCKNIFRGQ